jgi:hypothetical protein
MVSFRILKPYVFTISDSFRIPSPLEQPMSSIKSSYGHSERISTTPCLAWLFLGWIFCGFTTSASAQDESTGNLAAAAQNPIANMISLPLQNNTFFGVTESDETANVLNIQPVYPISAGDWNVITRTIVPIIHIPDPTSGIGEIPNSQRRGSATGLGDINFSAFLSPAHTGRVIWGVGPSLSVPSATDDQIGSEKWSAGPTAVALMSPKPWLFGALVKNLWSFAGDSDRDNVNQLLVQPFVNYNLDDGWYLVSSPIITANWEADSDNRWAVPVGGGVGKIFNIGNQPINAQVQSFYYAESPRLGPDWALRFQIQFLFPK